MTYVRGWAWCVRENDGYVNVFRYAAKPHNDRQWGWEQAGRERPECGAAVCHEGFYAATGLGPSDLPLDTPVKVRFGDAEVID